jgi:AraC-like DNA-binding protein
MIELPIHDRLTLEIVALGYSDLRNGWNYLDLMAPFWRLYANERTGAAVRIGSSWRPLEPGRLYLIPAWMKFASRANGIIGHAYAHFELRGISGPAVRVAFPEPCVIADSASAAQQLLAIGRSLSAATGATSEAVLRVRSLADAALADAVAGLSPTVRARTLPGYERGPLGAVLAHIHADPSVIVSNRDLARVAGCTPDHLVRMFHREMGQTPSRYVQELRMSAAAQALAHGQEPLEVVAEKFGFANRHSFTRAFIRHLGCGPAQWRKRNR